MIPEVFVYKNQKHVVYFHIYNEVSLRVVYTDISNWLSFVFSGFGRRIPTNTGRSWPSNCWAVREGALTLIYSRSALANYCVAIMGCKVKTPKHRDCTRCNYEQSAVFIRAIC
jgi:hypothetical protein